MTTKNANEIYRTSDLCLATTLSLLFPILSLEKEDRRVFFCFKSTPEFLRVIDHFWAGNLSFEPLRFFQQLKLLKSQIYGQS